MSFKVGDLYATLSIDDSGLARDLDRSIGQAESRVSRFSGAAKAALAAGLSGGLLAVARTGYQELMDAAKVQAQIAAGIKSTGGAAGVTQKHLEELAAAIQAYSGQTDDSIAQAEALLLTFTNIRNVGADRIFDEATKATADMAAKLGTDASDAAIQLGKALNDPIRGVTALRRVGVSFTEEQQRQIKAMVETGDVIGAQKLILAELQTEFGGAAKAAGESLPGQLERAKRAFEDASQEIMAGLAPALEDAAELIRKLAPHIPTLVKLAGAFGGLWAAVKGYRILRDAVGAARGFVGVLRGVGGVARGAGGALDNLGGRMVGVRGAAVGAGKGILNFIGKAGLVAGALAATSYAVAEAIGAWRQYRDAVRQAQEAYQGFRSTYSGAEAYIVSKYGEGSAQHKKWLKLNKPVAAAAERDRYKAPWWDITSWFGDGGDFVVRKPLVIGVGERGPERVQITPLGRPGAGGGDVHYHIHWSTFAGRPSRREIEGLYRELARAGARLS